jgi:uncharacterized protein YcfJ
MNQEPPVMEREPEEIQNQIGGTLSAMTHKLAALEQGVRDTVKDVATAVNGTYEGVKDTVKTSAQAVTETVDATRESVKQTVAFKRQVDRHPWWTLLFSSVVVGYVVGGFIARHYRRGRNPSAVPGQEGVAAATPPPIP